MEWVATIVVGVLSLIGVIITNNSANHKMASALEKSQAVTDTKITELTREVREHNNFARRVPVIEEKIENLTRRITDVEGALKK